MNNTLMTKTKMTRRMVDFAKSRELSLCASSSDLVPPRIVWCMTLRPSFLELAWWWLLLTVFLCGGDRCSLVTFLCYGVRFRRGGFGFWYNSGGVL